MLRPGVADDTAQRLEMLLVMQWLDEGASDDGRVALSVATAASELGLEEGRPGLLTLMQALGELEAARLAQVSWPAGAPGREALVTLSAELRHDARRLFGRP